MQKFLLLVTIGIYFLTFHPKEVIGQEIPGSPEDPFEIVEYQLNSGLHSGNANAFRSIEAFQANVSQQGAHWIRLIFNSFKLGDSSYIIITSNKDDSWQRLDAESMAQWGGTSAYFNGDAVNVTLHTAPDDENIYLSPLRKVDMGGNSTPFIVYKGHFFC